MSSSPARENSALYRPPSQRKPSATLGKPSPSPKFGTRTPRGLPTRNNVPPTPVTPSPFKARSRPASAASSAVTPDEAAAEPGGETGMIATKILEAPTGLTASTDELVGSQKPKGNESPEVKETQETESDMPPVMESPKTETPEAASAVEVESKQQSPESDAKNAQEIVPAAEEKKEGSNAKEPVTARAVQREVESKISTNDSDSTVSNGPQGVVNDVVAASADSLSVPDIGDSSSNAAANPRTPGSDMLTMAALSNKEWSDRGDDTSSVAGSVAVSISDRTTKSLKDKKEKEKKGKDAPKGSIQLGNHVIHPRKAGEPVPEWTPQQAVKPKERDEAKVRRISGDSH